MSRYALRISLISVMAAVPAFADTMRFQPNPTNLGNLNHNNAYSWRVDDVSLLDEMISDATLTISHIRNWNSSANTGSNFGEVGICQFKMLSSKGILVFSPPQDVAPQFVVTRREFLSRLRTSSRTGHHSETVTRSQPVATAVTHVRIVRMHRGPDRLLGV